MVNGPTSSKRPLLASWLSWLTQTLSPSRLLWLMMLLQMAWVLLIAYTGAATAVYKLPHLAVYTLLAGLFFIFLPHAWQLWLHQKVEQLGQTPKVTLVLLSLFLLAVGAFYASQQRLWPFDEEASYAAAVTVAQEGIAGLLHNYGQWDWLANQHPPLAPILYGQFARLFGQILPTVRFLSLLFSLGSGWLTYLIGRDLYSKQVGLAAMLLLFTFPLLMRLTATAMVEPALTFFFTLAVYWALMWYRFGRLSYLLALGLTLLLGVLTKYTMVLVLPLVVGIGLLRGDWAQVRRWGGWVLLGFIGAGLLAALLVSRSPLLQNQMQTLWHYAGLVLTNEYGRRLLFETLTNRLPSALGVYHAPLLGVGLLLLLNRRSRADWVILGWITAVWLPVLLTLPDHRYFMSSFPALALLMANGCQLLPKASPRQLLLSAVYCAGALYLFVDWARAADLFLP